MAKIKVKTPVVELDGDEMTRIIRSLIKDQMVLPYLENLQAKMSQAQAAAQRRPSSHPRARPGAQTTQQRQG